MKNLLLASAIVGALSVAAVADANAWTRSGTTTGPRGTSSVSVTGSCANGSCTRSATRTGPAGNKLHPPEHDLALTAPAAAWTAGPCGGLTS
jgi:uncharacterized low-complexity protein